MGRSRIEGFMPEVRQMIMRRIFEKGFQGYEDLAKELTGEGIPVSRSALHRFAMKFRSQLKQAELDVFKRGVEEATQPVKPSR